MLPEDTFTCRYEHGVAICIARQPSAETAYRQLVLTVQSCLGKLEAVGVKLPVQQITMGQTIGASMVIAVQGIVGLLSLVAPLPPSLAPLFEPGSQPAQLVVVVGARADEITGYINAVLTARPDAFQQAIETARTPPQQPVGSASVALGALFTKERLIALGVGAAVVGSLIALARSSDRRLSGKIDRTGLFPDPNAPVDDGDDDDHDEPEPEVIEAESVEVESEPAA